MEARIDLLRRLWSRLDGERRSVFADRLRLAGLLDVVQESGAMPPAHSTNTQAEEGRFDARDFEERAAIMEFDGGLSLAEAEGQAREIAMRNGTGR